MGIIHVCTFDIKRDQTPVFLSTMVLDYVENWLLEHRVSFFNCEFEISVNTKDESVITKLVIKEKEK